MQYTVGICYKDINSVGGPILGVKILYLIRQIQINFNKPQCYISIFKTYDIFLNSHCVKFANPKMMCMAGAIESPDKQESEWFA
jgi:hypothetical protein